jgi:hypothetical protein
VWVASNPGEEKWRLVKKEKMEVESVALSELKLDNRNARKGNISGIAESLEEFGQHRPVVVQKSTKKIIAGNHLYKAAKALGWSHVDVFYVDDDDKKALRRSLADNVIGDTAKWEESLLSELLLEAGPVPGYDQEMLDKLLEDTTPKDEEPTCIFPIVARTGEKYDYVIIVAEKELDCTWIREKFDLRPEQSYKGPKVSTTHVVSVERLQELWK